MINLLSKLFYQHIGTDQSLWAYRCQHIALVRLHGAMSILQSYKRLYLSLLFVVLAGNADWSDSWILDISSLIRFQVIYYHTRIHCLVTITTTNNRDWDSHAQCNNNCISLKTAGEWKCQCCKKTQTHKTNIITLHFVYMNKGL